MRLLRRLYGINTWIHGINTGIYGIKTGIYGIKTGIYGINTVFFYLELGFPATVNLFYFLSQLLERPSKRHK